VFFEPDDGGGAAPPSNRPAVTIVGDILGGITGTTADATVTLALPPDVTIRDATDNEVLVPQSQAFPASQFATGVQVPPTEDSTASPSTWYYLLTESWPGGRKGAVVTLPASPATVHYADLVDADTPPALTPTAVPTTRTVSTTTPLTGGGDLSQNRTFALDITALVAALATAGYYLVQNDVTGPYINTGA
jgi:hypothetical protein